MNDFIQVHRLLVLLIDALGAWLIYLILSTDSKSKINRTFSLLILFVLLWISFAFFANLTEDTSYAVLWIRATFVPVFLFFISLYYFVIFFPKEGERHPLLDKIILTVVSLCTIISCLTDLLVSGAGFNEWGVFPIWNKGQAFIYGFIFLYTVLILGIMLKKYFGLSGIEKIKVGYFLMGLFLFLSSNVVFNLFLSGEYGNFPYYVVGNYSAIILLGFTAYAIMKRNLFGIKVVLTQMFVVLIALLLLVNFLTSQTEFEYFWKGAILATFCLFGWLLIKSVVREIKQKEQLNQYADDMAKTNAELQTAYGKLEILDKAKSEFVSIASHQLRTPLTAIKGYISMMIEGDYGKISKQATQSMKNVYLANERLVKLVNSLLDMSRLESGKITLDFSSVKVDDLVAGILRELRQEAENKKLKLKMDKDRTTLPKIQADPTKLRDALMNLVDNAIKYTNKGGVTVNIKHNEGKIIITVADTGEGMTQAEIDKLFQSFSRTDSGRKNWSEGSGLGLYIAKKFIEMHHGNIRAESPGKGQGSRFIVELPVAQPS